MLTVGVDLAAEPRGTALAVVRWADGAAVVEDLVVGVTDGPIVDAARHADKTGIDCALGWPDAFVSFVAGHAAGEDAGPEADGGMDWRRTLAYREADRRVRELTGRWPLSVSTDRLGLTAMRCAGLVARLRDVGVDVDRSGSGGIAEVYPGGSMRLWGIRVDGYRTDADRRAEAVEALTTAAPWLDLGGCLPLLRGSTDAFDALVAALATRAAATGRADSPPPHLAETAAREGWVALPTTPLAELPFP
ncbi:uncharacterized protein DUF429 [Labedella gwakjiensis]|uniref:DUF429 domain-containing protein n=1 Tax=Labedella gwakjiensis TaxID=390269 RepID=A0A2P8GTG9_9MICO|nr:DUF429 domain-containing protein [Labedella gwakjiensis]PSL37261.1 uncharacterized protein DUF429 [Labedella gwakjiensis]RUQ84591.1 DUF429 domain-containing protein [Labedella gwakjiensis]